MKTFKFLKDSEVDVQFKRKINKEYDIRYSLALCQEEKNFRKQRLKIVAENLNKLLGNERGPRNENETPCIGILGSGGGYRALCGFSGALSALKELGLFDCAMYTCGLSGSSWCQSALYSHPSFPDHGVDHAIEDMKKNMRRNCLSFLTPTNILRYLNIMKEKRKLGQPTTFTDFFGLMVAEHLLGPSRCDTVKLSNFEEKLDKGQSPMLVMSCVHVRSKVSAQVFHEWVEFTPYEIGIPKYGTFVRTSDFNNKFFMGAITKAYPEPPLHFLMGIWGSAYCINATRLMTINSAVNYGKETSLKLSRSKATFDSSDDDPGSDDDSDFDNLESQEIERAIPCSDDAIYTHLTAENKTADAEVTQLKNYPNAAFVLLHILQMLTEKVKSFFGFGLQESKLEKENNLKVETEEVKSQNKKEDHMSIKDTMLQALMNLKCLTVCQYYQFNF